MASAPYDPGKPTPVRMIDERTFECESFRGGAAAYRVTLAPVSCSCPHYQARMAATGGECKHVAAARAQKPFLIALARAKELTDEALDQYLAKYASNPLVGGALRVVRAERRTAALRQAKIGTSVRLPGEPANEALKELFR